MALTKGELEEIKDAVHDAVSQHRCRFVMSDDEARDISKVVDIFQELGESSIDAGLVVMRENHIWLQKRREELEPEYLENHRFVSEMRRGVAVAKSAGIKALVGALITAILGGLWLVLKYGRP